MIHEELNLVLAKWIEIVGPDADGSIKNYDYKVSIDELNEAQQLDDTGLTTAMVLRSMWNSFSSHLKVSLHDIIKENPKVLRQIELYKDLQKLLHTTTIDTEIKEFQDKIIDSLKYYCVSDETINMAMDSGSLGLLRRDALRSMNTFSVFQFAQGRATTTKMKYAPMVYRFDNIQSLVSAMVANGEPGVALCHILDPDGLEFSYFVFSVWNGGTLTIVTDKRNYKHPLQKTMERCPGRSLLERWGKHHFPYELLNAQFSDDNKHVLFEQKPGLVRYNMEATRIAEVWKLEPDVVIWLIMVFEQLQQKYFVENFLLPDLSYTGDVVQKQVPIQNNLMKLGGWSPPTIPEFKSSDLTKESTSGNWHHKQTGFNEWLEVKYRDIVPDSILNLVSDGKKLLTNDEQELSIYSSINLKALSPYDFGSNAQLKADCEFIARYNQAKAIQHLATQEFESYKDDVTDWYRGKILANREFLIDAACKMELILPETREKKVFSDEMITENVNKLYIEYDSRKHCDTPFQLGFRYYGALIGRLTYNKWYCAVYPDTVANISVFIDIRNTESISFVTNTPVNDLPDVLQHYELCEPYSGNQILDRVDPMEWVVDNPWKKLKLGIKIVMSKKGFKHRRKLLGLPEFTNWASIERPKDEKY